MTAALEGGEWSAARPGRTLPIEKDPVPIVQEAGWVPGPVWTGGKSCPHRDFFNVNPCLYWYLHVTESTGGLLFLADLFVPYST